MDVSRSISDITALRSWELFPSCNVEIPVEVILSIFNNLEFQNFYLVTSLVCRSWKKVWEKLPQRLYEEFIVVEKVGRLAQCLLNLSKWNQLPEHWDKKGGEPPLQFTCVSEDVAAFYSPENNPSWTLNSKLSSKVYSFASPLDFPDNYIFLDRYKKTYFFTHETAYRDDSHHSLGHEIVVVNMDQPNEKKEFSILQIDNLPQNELVLYEIKQCIAVSETEVIILAQSGELSLWNVEFTPTRLWKIHVCQSEFFNRVGAFLVSKKSVINLKKPQSVDHYFILNSIECVSGKTLYCCNIITNSISAFCLDDEGTLTQRWNKPADELIDNEDLNSNIKWDLIDANDQFVLVKQHVSKDDNKEKILKFILLDSKNGDYFHPIREKYEEFNNTPLFSGKPRSDGLAYLTESLLVYQRPNTHAIVFVHLRAKRAITTLDSVKLVKEKYGYAVTLQDFRYTDDRLTLLLLAESPQEKLPYLYQLIQLNTQETKGYEETIFS